MSVYIDSFPKGGITLIQLEGVNETQLHWLDSGQVGTPFVISSLNGLADMWGPESWQTNKLIESEIMLHIILLANNPQNSNKHDIHMP